MAAKKLPADLDAEAALLGCLLLSTRACSEIIDEEGLTAAVFYSPTNATVFQAIHTCWLAGGDVDVVEVLNELKRMDSTIPFSALLELQNATPAISSARRYCALVRETALQRRLVHLGSEISAAAFQGTSTVEQLISNAEAAVAEVALEAESTTGEVEGLYERAVDILPEGVTVEDTNPWAIPLLLRRGETVILVAPGGSGKALDINTPVPTTRGMKRMADLIEGDYVFGRDGAPTLVVATSEVEELPSSAVRFRNDETIVAADSHLWTVRRRESPKSGRGVEVTVRTDELRPNLDCTPLGGPTATDDVDLPIDPYLLGVWLGDGTSSAATLTLNKDDAAEIIWRIEERTNFSVEWRRSKGGSDCYQVAGRWGEFLTLLRAEGLYKNKHIPRQYLDAGLNQRLELLRGLIDTDSHVDQKGKVEFCTTTPALAEGFDELLSGLGHKARCMTSEAKLNGRVIGPRFRFSFAPFTPHLIAHTPRRVARLGSVPAATEQTAWLHVDSVEPVGVRSVRCIQVAAADGLYQAGRKHVVTHNSSWLRQLAYCAENSVHPVSATKLTRHPRKRALIVELEAKKHNIAMSNDSVRLRLAQILRCRASDIIEPAVLHRQGGLNVRDPRQRAHLVAAIRRIRPELVCMGPLKYMYGALPGENHEQTAVEVQKILNQLMERYEFSMAIEAHSSKSDPGRVAGSERWADWPDLGFAISTADADLPPTAEMVFDVTPFRFPRNSQARLPNTLVRGRRGSCLPWSVDFGVEKDFVQSLEEWL